MFGGVFTIWNSTFFDGSNLEILLRHSRYSGVGSPAHGECNQGSIMAKSIGIYHQYYISQLIVTIEEEMSNRPGQLSVQLIILLKHIIGQRP